jgi:serine/threonine protein kinase/tetratricopeptide (TPR) repeat protein
MPDPQDTTWDVGPDSETKPTPISRFREKDPEQIGPYRIVSKLGEGGFGQVFLAEQSEPIKRKVAVKVIKPGMGSDAVVARFEQERQALAVMDHPGVAKVFDGGVTEETHRPYFVMEYVAGHPLTRFADDQRMTVRRRVELMIQVAEAVHHAHMKGVIHRDLKPGNILARMVDGHPKVTVIDFGVAKALRRGQDGFDEGEMTEAGQVIGSRDYMSPEQADSGTDDIDTRTDVYALGVVLYELLTGVTPFDKQAMRGASFMELQRIIKLVDPAKPSQRFRGLSAVTASPPEPGETPDVLAWHRNADDRAVERALRGELDWICMKCLEKDRDRRYDTAGAFALELMRFLSGEPVIAGPPSGFYRARKFVRRNTAAVAGGAAALAALVVGAGVALGFGLSEAEQRRIADGARKNLEEVVDFQADMLRRVNRARMGGAVRGQMESEINRRLTERGATPEQVDQLISYFEGTLGLESTASLAMDIVQRNMLGDAVEIIDRRYADDPVLRAALRQTVGDTYLALGMNGDAEEQITLALEARRRELGETHPDTLESVNGLGLVFEASGRLDEAREQYTIAMNGLTETLGPYDRETLSAMGNLGAVLLALGEPENALPFARSCLDGLRETLGDDHPDTLGARNNLGVVLMEAGQLDDAESALRRAVEGRRMVMGEDHQETLTSVHNLALVLQKRGKYEDAFTFGLAALEGRRAALGDDHPETLASMTNLGRLYQITDRPQQAEPLLVAAQRGFERVHGPDHPSTILAANLHAANLMSLGRLDEAAAQYRSVLERRRRSLGADHPQTLGTMTSLGSVLIALDRYDEAEGLHREASRGYAAVLGETDATTGRSVFNTAYAIDLGGDPGRAIDLYAEAIEISRSSSEPDGNANLGTYLFHAGEAHAQLGLWADAEALLLEADVLLVAAGDPHLTRRSAEALAGLYEAWDTAEPGASRAAHAAEWRRVLTER